MSRTYKDRKARFKYPDRYLDFSDAYEKVPYTALRVDTDGTYYERESYWYKSVAGIKTKKKRNNPGEYFWHRSSPGWFTRLMMNRPERRAARIAERRVLLSKIDEFDFVDTGRKPHIYYW